MGARRIWNPPTYFEWLRNQVENEYEPYGAGTHRLLLRRLYELEFYATLDRDNDRIIDGMELRNLYDEERMYPDDREDRYAPCSMLEMIFAMCKYLEEHVMSNDLYGNRFGKWFWTMIENAGLAFLTDRSYSSDADNYVTAVVAKINDRKYDANGDGSFFPLRNPRADMRNVDLWYQCQWYITENFNGDW